MTPVPKQLEDFTLHVRESGKLFVTAETIDELYAKIAELYTKIADQQLQITSLEDRLNTWQRLADGYRDRLEAIHAQVDDLFA